MQLTHDDLTFLARFAKSPDGRALQRIYAAKLRVADEALRNAQGEEVFRAQGRAQILAHLIVEIESAQQKLERNASAPSREPRRVTDSRGASVPYQDLQ
jgi:hypothetical protein